MVIHVRRGDAIDRIGNDKTQISYYNSAINYYNNSMTAFKNNRIMNKSVLFHIETDDPKWLLLLLLFLLLILLSLYLLVLMFIKQ